MSNSLTEIVIRGDCTDRIGQRVMFPLPDGGTISGEIVFCQLQDWEGNPLCSTATARDELFSCLLVE